MKVVILIVGYAHGVPSSHDGKYLRSFDPEAHDGRGHVVTTDDVEKAQHFATWRDAHECWRAVPACKPTRVGFDDKPNRPLTAFTIEVQTLDTARELARLR